MFLCLRLVRLLRNETACSKSVSQEITLGSAAIAEVVWHVVGSLAVAGAGTVAPRNLANEMRPTPGPEEAEEAAEQGSVSDHGMQVPGGPVTPRCAVLCPAVL